MRHLKELLSAAAVATQFLQRYAEGGRGYTTQDVEAGIQRLQSLYRQIEQAEKPGRRYAEAAAIMLHAAEQSIEQARDRLSGIEID